MAYDEVKYRWTGDDWAQAAAAKKAKAEGANPLPKILVTPYGLSPFHFNTAGAEGGKVVIKLRVYLVSDGAKKPLEAWNIAVGDEVMIPLELARFGEPWMRDRFYKKGQVWDRPAAQANTGGTLEDLGRSLHLTKEPQYDVYHVFRQAKLVKGAWVDKTQQEWDADAAVRDRILSKLVGHWQNTDYHFEQVRQGLHVNGNLNTRLQGSAGNWVQIEVVLSEPPAPLPAKPAAPQDPGGGGAGATVTVPTPAGAAGPPAPFDKLPDPLKENLVKSYQDRKDNLPGAEQALIEIFSKGSNVWEALDRGLNWQDINTMVRVYQRLEAVDKTHALWRDHIQYVKRPYTDGIYALELIYSDRAALRTYLDEISRRNDVPGLANASGFFQSEHPGTAGWREVSLTDQLHISVQDGTKANAEEDCHIDGTSVTEDKGNNGKADPAYLPGVKHYVQSAKKWVDIKRPFAKLEEYYNLPKNSPRRPVTQETIDALDRWYPRRGEDAVAGEEGHKRAVELLDKVENDLVNRPFSGSPQTNPYLGNP